MSHIQIMIGAISQARQEFVPRQTPDMRKRGNLPMKFKWLRDSILLILPLCIAVLLTGCGGTTEQDVSLRQEAADTTASSETDGFAVSVSAEDEVIHFLDPVIEAETRRILNKPAGDITKEEVLEITDFGVDREYEDYGSLGKSGSVCEKVTTLMDLQWFQNLKVLILSDCDLDNLEGIEELTELRVLYVRSNRLTNLDPVKNLTKLAYFDCSGNDINDYSALSGLTEMKELCIGDNGGVYTDLSPLENMIQLYSLYAPYCGIEDISVLKRIPDLEYLQLFHNNISDISALAGLKMLDYLELGMNKVENIDALSGLKNLTHINLQSNPISQEELEEYYTPKAEDYFNVTIREKIREDMPEFQFVLRACLDKRTSSYAVDSITISDAADGTVVQTVSIPEMTLFGQTHIQGDKEDMGFALEDVNFDGYGDIRLFDTLNGNYCTEWIYLVWNPEKAIFEQNTSLNAISLASFDQENQLIYGMERDGAFNHYYSTYRYMDGIPVLIGYKCNEYVERFDSEQIRECLVLASIETEAADFTVIHEMELEWNDAAGELETHRDVYEIYSDGLLLHVDAESELGRFLAGADS